jgi:ATP-dependent DNA ligase
LGLIDADEVDTEPEGSQKYFGPLLVGFYEGKKLKFAGRVGTGFGDKLLHTLFTELNKIRVDKVPYPIFRRLAEAVGTKG